MKVYFGIRFEHEGELYGDYIECELEDVITYSYLMIEHTRQVYDTVVAKKRLEAQNDPDKAL